MEKWAEIKQLLSEPKKIIITSHQSPDGDSIGSSLAMYHYLNQLGHDVQVVIPDGAADFLKWMAGFDEIKVYESESEIIDSLIAQSEMIYCLDFNSLKRLGDMGNSVQQSNAYIVNIDHHQEPEKFANFEFLDNTSSSTAQLVYEFIENLDHLSYVNKSMADCIYTGIMTDTGSFRFSSTSEKTHHIASEMLKLGVKTEEVQRAVFDNYSEDRLKLLGFALNNNLILLKNQSAAIIHLDENELSQFNFQKGDTEGMVNYPLSIKWVQISILITENNGKVKLSFRSKGNKAVNLIAKNYFNGGGHQNAAGGISDRSVKETVIKLKEILA